MKNKNNTINEVIAELELIHNGEVSANTKEALKAEQVASKKMNYNNINHFYASLKKRGITLSFEEKIFIEFEFGKAQMRKELPMLRSLAVSFLSKENQLKFNQ